MLRQSLTKKKKRKGKLKKAKVPTKGPNPRVPYLVFPPKLDSDDRYATPPK